MEVKGVIFDMDGVVFDSESLWKMAYIQSNAKFGVNLSEEFRKSICGKSEEMIRAEIKKIYPLLDVDAYRDYSIQFVNEKVASGEFDVKEGFLDAVKYFRNKGYKLALATSSYKSRAIMMFEKKDMDLSQIFDAYTFLEDVGANSKPNPYIFKITADKMGVPYENCVVLEDSINGITAAVNGGMIPIHVLDLIEPDEFCKENCFVLVKSLKELASLI